MKRIAVAVLLPALLTIGCPDDRDPAPNRQTGSGTGSVAGESPGIPSPGAVPSPPVITSPDVPAEAEVAELGYRQEAAAAEPASDALFPPALLLARNPQEAERAAIQTPPQLAQRIRSWTAWSNRALLVVIGGTQPDGSYGMQLTKVVAEKGGATLAVSGRLTTQGQGGQPATLWALLSVNAGTAARTQKCRMIFEGQTPRTYECG